MIYYGSDLFYANPDQTNTALKYKYVQLFINLYSELCEDVWNNDNASFPEDGCAGNEPDRYRK